MKFARPLMLSLSFLAAGSSIAGLIYYNVNEAKKREAYFQEQEEKLAAGEVVFSGPYCYPDPHSPLLTKIVLNTAITFVLLFFLKNPAWSFPTALFSVSIYSYWYLQTQRDLSLNSLYQPVWFDSYLLNASVLDLLSGLASLSLVIVFIIWLCHSLVLMLNRKKNLA